MTVVQAVFVGVIQGLTEFLPVSSDGHLVLADLLFHLPLEGRDALGFDILLHAGSLVALLVAYRTTWTELVTSSIRGNRESLRLVGLLVLGTIPGVAAGLLFSDMIGDLRSLTAAGLGFFVTGLALVLGERLGREGNDEKRPTVTQALYIGIAQTLAILPGVSRSGLTIATGRAFRLPRAQALDFSFLLAIPIVGGAVVKTLLDAFQGSVVFPSAAVSAAGFIASLLVSMVAIAFLRRFVVRRSLAIFAWYLIPLSVLLLIASKS